MATSVVRHLKVYWKLVRFAVSLELEYRFAYILEVFVELAFFAVTLMGLRVLFWNVSEVAGWDYYELMVLSGVNMVFSELLLGTSFIFNLRSLPYKIVRGDLDIILTKPINSQFAVSLWRPYFAMVPSALAGAFIAYLGFSKGGFSFHLANVPASLLIFGCGLIMAYSIGVIVTSLAFWFTNATPLPMLAQQVLFMSKNPAAVFTGAWRMIFMTILPIAFMVSFPSSVLLGDLQLWWLPASLVLAVVFLKSSNLFWNFALKKYSSASS